MSDAVGTPPGEHLLFLTGRLAETPLRRVLEAMAPTPFSWEVREIGLQVAALMTTDMVRRRLAAPLVTAHADGRVQPVTRVVLPGRARGDVDALSAHYGVRVERGPEELKDLPRHFDREARPVDLSRHATTIFAEIVDAPQRAVAAIVARAHALRAAGADVIDLGSLPATPFPHLADAVRALKAEGFAVSVDSLTTDELLAGGRAGADYLLSLTADTLWVADEVASTPVLIPRGGGADTASLDAAIDGMRRRGRPFLADPILDPVPYGLAASIARYVALRERHPDVEMLMGTGNVSELMEADTSGLHALLLGLCAELRIGAVLTTQVSPHARRAVREIELARRIMHAAVRDQRLPKALDGGLSTVHDRAVPHDDADEIAATAAQVRDPNFRIQVSADGLHAYNRDGHRRGRGAFELWPALGVQHDASHAFYLGHELAKAEIAWRLGKRYVQDQPLDWGVAADAPDADAADGHRLRDAVAAPATPVRADDAAAAPTSTAVPPSINVRNDPP